MCNDYFVNFVLHVGFLKARIPPSVLVLLCCLILFVCRCIRHSLPTCTGQPVGDSPFFDTSDNFCPLPPSVAFTDLDNRDTLVGPLDGYDVYIAERLLRLSGEDLNTNDFFLRVQVANMHVYNIYMYMYVYCTCVDSVMLF